MAAKNDNETGVQHVATGGGSRKKKNSSPSDKEAAKKQAELDKTLDLLFKLAENEENSWEDIAKELNKKGYKPPRGDKFTGSKVAYLHGAYSS